MTLDVFLESDEEIDREVVERVLARNGIPTDSTVTTADGGEASVSLDDDGSVFVIQSLLLLISGVYYSVDILPGWMRFLSQFSPATYVLDAVRAGLIDGVGIGSLLGDVWPLLLMGIVFIPLGLWAFGRAERYAKRTGKLKRVG